MVKSVEMTCPICGEQHNLELRTRKNKITIKGEEVEYEEKYYKCDKYHDEESEFCNGKQNDENLLNARNAYRKKMGLLTSEEIANIRKEYELSQVELARLMGVGDVTIARYETKAIQEPIYDNILRRIKTYPMEALELLKINKDKFSEERYSQIFNKILENQSKYGIEMETRKLLQNDYINYSEPCAANGYKVLDIDLIEKIISYIAFSRENLYKTVLMKFLWYIDKISYSMYKKSITGLVYVHESYGALPLGHYNLVGLNNVSKQELFDNGTYKIKILPSPNVSFIDLTNEQKKIIDQVLDKFKAMRTNDIVETMHNEPEYVNTKMYDVMMF